MLFQKNVVKKYLVMHRIVARTAGKIRSFTATVHHFRGIDA